MAKKGSKKKNRSTGGKKKHGRICYTPCRKTGGKQAGRFTKC